MALGGTAKGAGLDCPASFLDSGAVIAGSRQGLFVALVKFEKERRKMSEKQTRLRPGPILLLFLLAVIVLNGCGRQMEPLPTAIPTAAPPPAAAGTPVAATAATVETVTSGAGAADAGAGGLTDTLWVLVAYGDPEAATVVEGDTLVTLIFAEDGTLSGTGGCNNFSASYEAAASGALAVGPVAMTRSVCDRGMEQERAVLAVLPSARQYTFDERERLQLLYEGGDGVAAGVMTFARGEVPLAGTPWTLIAFGDAEAPDRVEAGTAITALFTEMVETQGTVSGFAGCNDYTAGYTLGEGILEVRNPVSTRRGCPVGVSQEAAYLRALATTHTYRIIGQTLEVDYDGGVLFYRAAGLPLTNVLWRLVAVNGQAVPDNTPISLLFLPGTDADRGEVQGTAGCTTYRSAYQRDERQLTVSPPEVTGSLCAQPFAYEEAFLEALATAAAVAVYGEQMALETADASLAFAAYRAPLERVAWELTSFGPAAEPQALPDGSVLRTVFVRSPERPSGLMVGETACNSFSAAYAASADEIGINEPVKSVAPTCTVEQLAQEEQIFQLLTAAGAYRILGNHLQIGTGDGALNFSVAQTAEAEPTLAALDGTTWYLLSLFEQPLRDGTQITAHFTIDDGGSTGSLGGSAGCNRYNAPVTGDMTIGLIAKSRRLCPSPPGVMEQEDAYLAALATVQSRTLSGNQLLLNTANGVLAYANQPAGPSNDQSALLRDVDWYLLSYGTTPASSEGDLATATFAADGTVAGNTGCNSFNGSYSTSGRQMEIGTLATTRAACSGALPGQESYVLAALQGAQSYLIASSHLQIRSGDGVLNFSSVPPPEGGEGGQLEAVIRVPTSAQVGEAITFDATASVHSRPLIKFIWSFGDGAQASGPVVEHAYSSAGAFVAELLISDDRGANATTTQQILVSTAGVTPPTAAVSGPATAQVGETVTFSAAGTTAGGGGEPLRYTWYFGDGGSVDSGTAAEVSYVYGAPGVYQVSLLVTAGDGSSDSAGASITIGGGLEQTTWVWGNGPAPITLHFAGGTVTGFAGCNDYNAIYTVQGDQISISQPFAGDNQCPPDVMNREQQFLNALPHVTTFQINENRLRLTDTGGNAAVFYAQN